MRKVVTKIEHPEKVLPKYTETIIKWEADDGISFETEAEAIQHDNTIKYLSFLNNTIKPSEELDLYWKGLNSCIAVILTSSEDLQRLVDYMKYTYNISLCIENSKEIEFTDIPKRYILTYRYLSCNDKEDNYSGILLTIDELKNTIKELEKL